MGVKIVTTAAAIAFAAAIGSRVLAIEARGDVQSQKTTRDKVYSKEQAARGGELYVKHCERCHDPAKVPEGKKPGPPTVGEKFMEVWLDRTLGELYSSIISTMPSDGSAVLTVDQTLDLVAHILKTNGYPEGTAALKNDDATKNTVITTVK